MDRLPPHLWYSVLQLAPHVSLAWASASRHTLLALKACHHESLDDLVTRQCLQVLWPAHFFWKRRSAGNAALVSEHRKEMSRELVRRGDLAACRWLAITDWQAVARWATEFGRLACAAWAFHTNRTRLTRAEEKRFLMELATLAARHGQLHICAWLDGLTNLQAVSADMSMEAAFHGHLSVLQFLVAQSLATFSTTADTPCEPGREIPCVRPVGLLISAVFSEHIDICRWLCCRVDFGVTWEDVVFLDSVGPSTLPLRHIFLGVVRRGLLEACRWLHATYCIPTHVVTHDHCEVLRVSCNYGALIPHEERTCRNWKVCQWLYETFVCVVHTPLEQRTLENWEAYTRARQAANQLSATEFVAMAFPAMVNAGSVQGVIWLQKTFSQGDHPEWPHWVQRQVIEIGQGAIDSGNVILCIWLGVDTITDTRRRLIRAVERGHVGILKWLHKTIPQIPWPDYLDDLCLAAARHGRVGILDWLIEQGLDSRATVVQALREAMSHGHLTMCQRLTHHFFASLVTPNVVDKSADFMEFLQAGLLPAIWHGHLDVCLWATRVGAQVLPGDMTPMCVGPANFATWQWAWDTCNK